MIPLSKLLDKLIDIPQDASVGVHPETGDLVFAGKSGKHLRKHDITLPPATDIFPVAEAAPFRFCSWELLQEEAHACQCEVQDNSLSEDFGSTRNREVRTMYVEIIVGEAGVDALSDEEDSLRVRLSATLMDWLNGTSEFKWLRKRGICAEFYAALCNGSLVDGEALHDGDVNHGFMDVPLAEEWRERVKLSIYCDCLSLSGLYIMERFKTGGKSFFEEPEEPTTND